MAQVASILAVLAAAGAIVSWVAGALFYARTLRTLGSERRRPRMTWLAVAAWPFATARIEGAAAAQAANVNKALVALLACLIVAAAATSVATNLARVSR
jgi:hypothetical protein